MTAPAVDRSEVATGQDTDQGPRVVRTAWRLLRQDPWAYARSWCQWVAFHSWPLLPGLVLKAVLDRVADDSGGVSVWTLLAVLAGVEVARWALFVWAVVVWSGLFVSWQTVPRLNLLHSLLHDPGPVAGRLPGSPGEAVSRFRDDTRDLAFVLDVWLDISGSVISAVVAVAILASIDPVATVVVVLPVAAALAFARWLGPRLKAWRTELREATGAVTGFLGDTFGAILAVKAAGAERAVAARFAELNAARRRAARRDQVGLAMVQSLGGVTGELGVGLVLLLVAPSLRDGSLGVGDVGLFASYVTVLAHLPRWAGRLSTYHRQGEVAVARLAELDAERAPERVVARPPSMQLRHRPAPLVLPPPPPAPLPFRALEVRGLTARHGGPGGPGIVDVDLTVRHGQLVAVTGPVGAGKSTLLRAILGLVPRQAGEILWDGEPLEDPGLELVPPRVAYVPQVPRLFSEPLADTVLLGLPPGGLGTALRLACLEEDVAAMPAGVATPVGSRGVRLSGGQAQRVAAARALVRRPSLLVVDDLSSALDAGTEARLWDGLLSGAVPTALVVTHRPQVLARADVVVELHDGRRIG